MRIDVVTLFPEMLLSLQAGGITARAMAKGLLQLVTWNPRDDTADQHRTVDDRPYGGGPGMVMKVQPLRDCLQRVKRALTTPAKVVYLSPQGQILNQAALSSLATGPNLVLIAGRYEGIDERFISAEVDEEWSIGDYVLSGGELAAMVMIDAISRLLPGALGDEQSAQQDSFSQGLLDHPHYTRPEVIDERAVPPVLLSGDHEAVRCWRLQQALGRTWLRRPDLLAVKTLDKEQQQLLDEFIQEHKLQHSF